MISEIQVRTEREAARIIKEKTMKKIKPGTYGLPLFLMICCLSSCSSARSPDTEALKLYDGYFTAEAASFDSQGWKEFVSIYVNNNKIVTVEYNAKNASGFIKSWDMDYMRLMNASKGTYPNKYTRTYAQALLNRQDPSKIDAMTGATESWRSFVLLAGAAIDQAKAGNKKVAFIDTSPER
jgi:major membrane immunogen (membrane-anchored lipoprotein)